MGYLDSSDAALIALTRQRRAERAAAHKVERSRANGTIYYRPKRRLTSHQAHPDPRDIFWQARRRRRPGEGIQNQKGEHPRSPWWRMFRAQSGACYLCGLPFSDDHWATEDHVVPRCKGGVNRRNIALAHQGCNTWKASRRPYPCEVLALEVINERIEWFSISDSYDRFRSSEAA